MATKAGRITLVVNGLPVIDLSDFSEDVRTNRELVVGMSPTNTPVGFVDGAKEFALTMEAYIPLVGVEPDWIDITDGIIMVQEQGEGGATIVYTGCFTTRVGQRYQEKGAAKRSIEMQAMARTVAQ